MSTNDELSTRRGAHDSDAQPRGGPDAASRIEALFEGHDVRVIWATTGAIGDVTIDGVSADDELRRGIRRALPELAFEAWPVVEPLDEVLVRAEYGTTISAAVRASGCHKGWPSAEEGPRLLTRRGRRWVAIHGGGPLLYVVPGGAP